jgi:hypothetical protein
MPSTTLVHIKGNIVSMAMNTGTIPELNHMRARRISEITGVERIIISIGLMNALNP